jgi:hypothetical protein
MLDYVSAQFATENGCSERYVLGEGAPVERAIDLPATHVRRVAKGAARVYELSRVLLRVAARALYVFPALLVVKAALWLAGVWWGDLITVAFVLMVVAFFAIFALTVLLYGIVGPRALRDPTERLLFAAPPADTFARAAELASTRVVGRLDAGLDPGAPVIVEQWSRGERLVRYVEGCSFAIVPDEGAPCVVELSAAPLLVGPYEVGKAEPPETAGRLQALGVDGAAPSARCVVRQGDRVELVGHDAQPTARIEDARLHALVESAAPTGPYRESEASALLVRCTVTAPVALRVLERRPGEG